MRDRINSHLFKLFLDVGIPVVLDLIICSSREMRSNLRPSVEKEIWTSITEQITIESQSFSQLLETNY
jgi:hypothetical protein